MHTDHQPIPWAISWTTSRCHGPEHGANVYISKYGIRIDSAPNNVVAWLATEHHGTSLQLRNPRDPNPGFLRAALTLFFPRRLPQVWKKYLAMIVSQEQALQELKAAVDQGIQYT